jgi:type III secretion protein HrpB1
MTPILERKPLVASLIDLACLSIMRNEVDDASDILQALRILRPKLLELDVLRGWIAMKQTRLTEAMDILRNLEASPTHWSMGRALTASCQRALGQLEWSETARSAMAPDAMPDAIDMASKLLAGTDADRGEVVLPAQAPLSFDAGMGGFGYYMRA